MRAMEGADSRPELLRVQPGAQQEAPAHPLHWQQNQPQPQWPALAAASEVRVPAQAWQQAQHSQHHHQHQQRQQQQQQQLQDSALRWQQEQLFMASREPHMQLHIRDSQSERLHGHHPRSDVQNKSAFAAAALEAVTAAPPLREPPQQAFKPVRVASGTSTQTSAVVRCVGPSVKLRAMSTSPSSEPTHARLAVEQLPESDVSRHAGCLRPDTQIP